MVYNSEVFWYLSPLTNCFSIFAIHMITYHLLVHPNSACFYTAVGWFVSLSTWRGLQTQVDHRQTSKLRVSHGLLKVYWPILCKNLESFWVSHFTPRAFPFGRLPRFANSFLTFGSLLSSGIDVINSCLILRNFVRLKPPLLQNSWSCFILLTASFIVGKHFNRSST